jgi:hypothetical protein
MEWTMWGVNFRSATRSKNINSAAPTKPTIGEVSIGTITLGKRPVSHFKTDQSPPAVARAAPQSPPMSAWLELEGSPSHHVIKFQTMAPSNAQRIVGMVITFGSTIPLPMVEATAVPMSAPVRLKKAARVIACRGVNTFVDTTVAIALAASWNPLIYSKASAARTTRMNRVIGTGQGWD